MKNGVAGKFKTQEVLLTCMDDKTDYKYLTKTAHIVSDGIGVVDEHVAQMLLRRSRYWRKEGVSAPEVDAIEKLRMRFLRFSTDLANLEGQKDEVKSDYEKNKRKFGNHIPRTAIPKTGKENSLNGMNFVDYIALLIKEIGEEPQVGEKILKAIPKLIPIPGRFDPEKEDNKDFFNVFNKRSGATEYVPYSFTRSLADMPNSRQHFSDWNKVKSDAVTGGEIRKPLEDLRVLIFDSGPDVRDIVAAPYDPELAANGYGTPVIIGMPFPVLLQIGKNELWPPAAMLCNLLVHGIHMLAGAHDSTVVEVPLTTRLDKFCLYKTTVSSALALGHKTGLRDIFLGSGISALCRTILEEVPQFTQSADLAQKFGQGVKSAGGSSEIWDKLREARKSAFKYNERDFAKASGYPQRDSADIAGVKDYGMRMLYVKPDFLAKENKIGTRNPYGNPRDGHASGYWGDLYNYDKWQASHLKYWNIALEIESYTIKPIYTLLKMIPGPVGVGAAWAEKIGEPVRILKKLHSAYGWGGYFIEHSTPKKKEITEIMRDSTPANWDTKVIKALARESREGEYEEGAPGFASAKSSEEDKSSLSSTGGHFTVYSQKRRTFLDVVAFVGREGLYKGATDMVPVVKEICDSSEVIKKVYDAAELDERVGEFKLCKSYVIQKLDETLRDKDRKVKAPSSPDDRLPLVSDLLFIPEPVETI
ncbi:hypothetical protein ACIQWR_39700 [Streptomyces sp. NPDC098789]|uniref:hypothetical protein n=1 Tax=Streptomyces sp. NPDC098789 TaxID=3366098 RepID=UPI003806BF94